MDGHSLDWRAVLYILLLVYQCCLKGMLSPLLVSGKAPGVPRSERGRLINRSIGGLDSRIILSIMLKCGLPKSRGMHVRRVRSSEFLKDPIDSAWECGIFEELNGFGGRAGETLL